MSADATGWVYRHSPFSGGTWSVHHAIADSANDQHGNRFWLTTGELASKARVSRATAVRALSQLQQPFNDSPDYAGKPFLRLIESTGGGGLPGSQASEYEFLFPDVPVLYDSRRRRTGASRRATGGDSSLATGVPVTSGSPCATGSGSPRDTSGSSPLIGNARVTNRTQINPRGNGAYAPQKPRPADVGGARLPEFTEEYRQALEALPVAEPAPIEARPEIQQLAPKARELREQLLSTPGGAK